MVVMVGVTPMLLAPSSSGWGGRHHSGLSGDAGWIVAGESGGRDTPTRPVATPGLSPGSQKRMTRDERGSPNIHRLCGFVCPLLLRPEGFRGVIARRTPPGVHRKEQLPFWRVLPCVVRKVRLRLNPSIPNPSISNPGISNPGLPNPGLSTSGVGTRRRLRAA